MSENNSMDFILLIAYLYDSKKLSFDKTALDYIV